MFLEPSLQCCKQLHAEVPDSLAHHIVWGSNIRCMTAAGLQLLSQEIRHPEFDLFIHHVNCREETGLTGMTPGKKWLWVIQYSGQSRVGFTHGTMLTIQEGQHFFIQTAPEREYRFTVAHSKALILMISIKPPGEKMVRLFYPDLWKRMRSKNAPDIFDSCYAMRFYWEAMFEAYYNHPSLRTAFLSAHWRQVLLQFSRRLVQTVGSAFIPTAQQEKALRAKQLLDQYPARAWTLKELARRSAWNIYDLRIVFKKVFAITPGRYLHQVRLGLALLLVRTTEKTIGEISGACGFKRPHHFIRVFKQVTGKTPGEMRKTARSGS